MGRVVLQRKYVSLVEVRGTAAGNVSLYPLFRKGINEKWRISKATKIWTVHQLPNLVPKSLKMRQLQPKAPVDSWYHRTCSREDKVIKELFTAIVLSPRSLSLVTPHSWTSDCPSLSFLKKLFLLYFCDYLGTPSFLTCASFLSRSLMEGFCNALSMVFFFSLDNLTLS